MNKLIKVTLLSLSFLAVAACSSGGGGNSSSGGSYFTHSELADDFVYRLNVDAGIDVELVKTNTDQYDYIVVYDYELGTYDAYYLGYYNPGESVLDYVLDYDYLSYYDLDYLGGNLYQDYWTGTYFEKNAASSKDLQKMAALKQGMQIKKSAEHIAVEYGLSESRSIEVASLAVQMSKQPKDSMTNQDYDNFATEILGNSITEYKSAMDKAMGGEKEDLLSLLDNAAAVNGVTPEDVDHIIKDVFGVSAKDL